MTMWARTAASGSHPKAKALHPSAGRRLPSREHLPTLGVDLGRMPLYPPALATPRGVLQAKLAVGSVEDPLEEEADRVAEKVLRMPDPAAAPGTPGAPGTPEEPPGMPVTGAGTRLSRKCTGCEEEDEKKGAMVQRRAAPGAATGFAEAPPIVEQALSGGGRPLDAGTRAYFEPRFGVDLGGVRVHTGARAEESARAVSALAYTVGRDIVFGEGRYAPGEGEGRRLLAHELAHVAQQGGGAARPAGRAVAVSSMPPRVARDAASDVDPVHEKMLNALIAAAKGDADKRVAAIKVFTSASTDQAAKTVHRLNRYGDAFSQYFWRSVKEGVRQEVIKILVDKVRPNGPVPTAPPTKESPKPAAPASNVPVAKVAFKPGDPVIIRSEGFTKDGLQMAKEQGSKEIAANLKPGDLLKLGDINPVGGGEVFYATVMTDREHEGAAKGVVRVDWIAPAPAPPEQKPPEAGGQTAGAPVSAEPAGMSEVFKKYAAYRNTYGTFEKLKPEDRRGTKFEGDAQKALTELLAELKPLNIESIEAFEAQIKERRAAFETATRARAFDRLDKLEEQLVAEQVKYGSAAQVADLTEALAKTSAKADYKEADYQRDEAERTRTGGMALAMATPEHNDRKRQELQERAAAAKRGEPLDSPTPDSRTAQATALAKKADAAVETVGDKHPLVRYPDFPKHLLGSAPAEKVEAVLLTYITEHLAAVDKTRKRIEGDVSVIYKLDKLLEGSYANLGVAPGGLTDLIVQQRKVELKDLSDGVEAMIGIMTVALTIVTLGGGGIVAAGGALSSSAVGAANAWGDYKNDSAAYAAQMSSVPADAMWVVLSLIMLGIDAGFAVGAVWPKVAKLVAAFNATRMSVAELDAALKGLVQQKEITDVARRAILGGANAEPGHRAAVAQLFTRVKDARRLATLLDKVKDTVKLGQLLDKVGGDAAKLEMLLKTRTAAEVERLSEAEIEAAVRQSAADGKSAAEAKAAATKSPGNNSPSGSSSPSAVDISAQPVAQTTIMLGGENHRLCLFEMPDGLEWFVCSWCTPVLKVLRQVRETPGLSAAGAQHLDVLINHVGRLKPSKDVNTMRSLLGALSEADQIAPRGALGTGVPRGGPTVVANAVSADAITARAAQLEEGYHRELWAERRELFRGSANRERLEAEIRSEAQARALVHARKELQGEPLGLKPGEAARARIDPSVDFPMGFYDRGGFETYSRKLYQRVGKVDPGAELVMEGSGVTGRRYERLVEHAPTGAPFDAGRLSDYDVGIVSEALLRRARQARIPVSVGPPPRTAPLNDKQLKALDLSDLAEIARDGVRDATGIARDVNFKIYGAGAGSTLRLPLPK